MDTSVISEQLVELLDNCEIRAAVFTTYTFEPEFFELEVIPLLLPGNIPFSSDSRVKQFQVREALRESGIELEVFYDQPMFRKEGSTSPAMEYRFHGIDRGNSAFHAKIAFILVHDHNYQRDCLLVGAGSNNLTRAGWWDNIECQHWEMVWPGETSRSFLNRLREDTSWLSDQRLMSTEGKNTALDQISAYLADSHGQNNARTVSYYGINQVLRGRAFPHFMRRRAGNLWTYKNWTLEIISPFFAEDSENLEHDFFFKMGVEDIHLLLPMDQEGNALCQREYFDHISDSERIHWAEWADDLGTTLGSNDQHFRRLHAKIYHFYNKVQSWAFVGSVNFTHKAMWDNIEAGFLVKMDQPGPLLKPIKQPQAIEHFQPPDEAPPGATEEADNSHIPRIYLTYNWLDKRLSGVTEAQQGYTINILTPEGDIAVEQWPITGTQRHYQGDTQTLKNLLKNGSLIKISGFNTRSEEAFPTHTIMLLQSHWTHKPLDLPDLEPEQILAIYADMAPDQRQLLLMNAHIRKLVLEGAAGDMTTPTDDTVADQFFSEYAEIFYAFRRLEKRLAEAQLADNHEIVDYYLTGTGMDSLPTLIDQIDKKDTGINPVTAYLLLLCAREIYQQARFNQVKLVRQHLTQVGEDIHAIKSSGQITLENNTLKARKLFFDWFEKQFFKSYRTVGDVP